MIPGNPDPAAPAAPPSDTAQPHNDCQDLTRRRLRICHFITGLEYGGAERLLLEMCRCHAPTHEISVLYLKGKPRLLEQLSGVVNEVKKLPWGLGTVRALHAEIQRIRPDIFHTHLGHADLLGLWCARKYRMAKFCTVHSMSYKCSWVDKVIYVAYRLLLASVGRDWTVIAISDCVRNLIVSRLGVRPERCHRAYNAIPDLQVQAEKVDARRAVGIPDDAFVVLFVGRLSKAKSVGTLLEAVRIAEPAVPKLKVVVLGEGEEEQALRGQAESLGEMVEFRGATTDTTPFYAAADIFVLPSISEGFGIVLLEAFRAGLPVVASRIEGPAEIVTDGRNGLLFEPRDARGLANQIVRLAHDETLRAKLGSEGRASFTKEFQISHYAEAIERLYFNACGVCP